MGEADFYKTSLIKFYNEEIEGDAKEKLLTFNKIIDDHDSIYNILESNKIGDPPVDGDKMTCPGGYLDKMSEEHAKLLFEGLLELWDLKLRRWRNSTAFYINVYMLV